MTNIVDKGESMVAIMKSIAPKLNAKWIEENPQEDKTAETYPHTYPDTVIFEDVITPTLYFQPIDRFESYGPHFYLSIRLLLSALECFGIGPIFSRYGNGGPPFMLSESARYSFEFVRDEDTGSGELTVKKAPLDVIENMLVIDPRLKENMLLRNKEIHSIKGGVLSSFVFAVRRTWAFKCFNEEMKEKMAKGETVVPPNAQWIIQTLKDQQFTQVM